MMFRNLKIHFHRFVAVCLVLTSLLISSAIAIPQGNVAMAEVLKKDAVGIDKDAPLDKEEYESIKANRNQLQAERSQEAEAKAEAKANSENLVEKLNLDEITPPGLDN